MRAKRTDHKQDMSGNAISKYAPLIPALILGLLLILYTYSGPDFFYDDATYLYLAHLASMGNNSIFLSRFAFGFLKIFQLAVPMYLFGFNIQSAVFVSVIDYLILVSLVFLSARELADGKNAWFAPLSALIAATFPFVVGYATRVLPDIPLGMVSALSIYLFIIGRKTRHTKLIPFLVGITTMLTVYMNEEGFIFAGAAFIALILINFSREKSNQAVSLFGNGISAIDYHYIWLFLAGITAGFLIYVTVFGLFTGNPLFPFMHYPSIQNNSPMQKIIIALFSPYIINSFVASAAISIDIFPLGTFFLLSLVGAFLALYKKERPLYYLAIIEIITVIYLVLGPSSPTDVLIHHKYLTLPTVSRMFALVALPAAILASYLFLLVFSYAKRVMGRPAAQFTIALIIAIALMNVPTYNFLRTQNQIINQMSGAFILSTEYVHNLSQAHANIYLTAQNGFDIPLAFSYLDLTNFSNAYSFSIITYSNSSYDLWPYSDKRCSDPGNDSFLVSLNAFNPALVYSWLSGNCTITYLRSFPIPPPYYGASLNLYYVKSST